MESAMKIQGSTILITGASSGIGAATAKAMARAGGRVLLLARTQTALEKVAAEIVAAGGEAKVYPIDLTDAPKVEQVAKQILAEVGTPDLILNNAGAGRWLFVEETSSAEALQMMNAPYFAAFYITRAFLPEMLRRGTGHIVTINSPVSRFAWPGATGYAAARWALRGFTEALRADLRGTGLRVTMVTPGLVDSPYFDHNPGAHERLPKIARLIPTLTPDQVAAGIIQAVKWNQRERVMPFMLWLFYVMHAVAPRIVEWFVTITGWQHRR
jgi:short-subunit dehydrogenase